MTQQGAKPTPVAVKPRRTPRVSEMKPQKKKRREARVTPATGLVHLLRWAKMKPLFVAIFAFVLSGCAERRPERIFSFRQAVIDAKEDRGASRMKVGEEVAKGDRKNGPWEAGSARRGRPMTPWTKQPLAASKRLDVTGNVRWIVSPPGAATFGGVERRERTVRFSMPGIYRIKAESAFPTLTYSNEVEVVDRRAPHPGEKNRPTPNEKGPCKVPEPTPVAVMPRAMSRATKTK
ncbi:MAG: hypothetical protein IPP19_15885 [Verrucomicrobia bacterium]|nr:hypothetical protein [Verrucomicrobiota bacterium]